MKISILGTRGIPAQHGGFETFAQKLALYLASIDWQVTVYCQEVGAGETHEDTWMGVRLVHVPVQQIGALATIIFDWKSVLHASRECGPVLTLGYNTALFSIVYRLRKIVNYINMDGIEWKRQKWSRAQQSWLYLNEIGGSWLGDHLIADHPSIADHLATRVAREKITTIAYGADRVTQADASILKRYGVEVGEYVLAIARPEPENSLLEIVSAFSRNERKAKLLVVGRYEPKVNEYHARVMEAAAPGVLFPGAIYEPAIINSLRFHAKLYVHGHRVGGTNPALVEALGAGLPVLAHDNKYNRWVAGSEARYFVDSEGCAAALDDLLDDAAQLLKMSQFSTRRHEESFQWNRILKAYEELLQGAQVS